MTDFEQWKGFEQGKWCDDIDNFVIQTRRTTHHTTATSHSLQVQ